MKTCPKCKEVNSDTARNCQKCGASLPDTYQADLDRADRAAANYRASQTQTEAARSSYYSRKSSAYQPPQGSSTALYILSFLIPLVGFIVGAIWLADGREGGSTPIILGICGIVCAVLIVTCSNLLLI
ncbi:MAG: hypothetical protein LIO87_05815 [Eubacterium sp.]|nr:hypothetical protein [Eubacterium sp.]